MDREQLNAEGYADPTAYGALSNIESRERARRLIRDILHLVNESGFELVGRIHIYDRKTGREYK